MKTCFFTTYDENAKEMAQGMVNSVKHWYPDIDFIEHVIPHKEIPIGPNPGAFDVTNFCYAYLRKGLELFDEYQRIIYIDPDSVMCNLCPDLFDDYELGVVRNNTYYEPDGVKGSKGEFYINAGLSVCSSRDVWQERIAEFERRNNQGANPVNEQNALNWLFHNTTHKVKLLEFDDRSYGISSIFHYQKIDVRNGELYLPSNKKLCIFHAAGVYWKTGTKINFEFIENEEARNLIIKYTHA